MVRNLGNTSNLVIKGSDVAGFIEGESLNNNLPRGKSHTQLAVGTTSTNIITLRNRSHFGQRINRAEVKNLLLTLANDSSRASVFELWRFPTFTGDLVFEYADKDNSVVEVSTSAIPVTGGMLTATFTAGRESLAIAATDIESIILPDEVVTIAARISGGAATDMIVSVVWQEQT